MQVLRPKVYITESFNFKRLVQDLTGNGSSTTQFPPPLTRSATETQLENIDAPVIDNRNEDDGGRGQSSLEAYSFEFCNNLLSPSTEGVREEESQMYLNDATYDMLSTNQAAGADWLAYQDLESWLLDIEQQPCSSFNGFGQHQEVSIYDYELSGLI
ncbi:VQ motif containing protein [Melia azedarach]|uniref:VQ motif containing protein n=1 Tax=Melia azedarach TaxID=155640 RepID=A0ACC1YY76_MELAZ|nr:VQ motif containing protein [Melia azedarach]